MRKFTPTEKQALGFYFQVPACLDVVQPILTHAAVRAAEVQLGVKLPEAYLKLLEKQNGGYLRATFPATYSRMLRGIGPSAHSITCEEARFRPKNQVAGSWAPKQAESLIPFDGDGDWEMCFDYRRHGPNAEPEVTLVDVECEEEEPLAASFNAFLLGLVDSLETSTRIYADVTAEGVGRALAQKLGAPIPRIDASTLGFVKWRIALRGDHQWCWVSDNRVPASFGRDAQTGRVRVSDETALQLPEDPECAVLVSCTEDVRSKAEVRVALNALDLALALP